MKRVLWLTLAALGIAGVAGCPVWSDDHHYRVCTSSGCYDCPDRSYSGSCASWQCNDSADCPPGYGCDAYNQCTPGSVVPTDGGARCTKPSDCTLGQNCGNDGFCHVGDCSNSGCPANYKCTLSGGQLACVSAGTSDGGTGCRSDASCAASLGAGAKCLNSTCVRPEDQCFDATQCTNGQLCVQGVCTPSCAGGKACPTGYACDSRGVCSVNPTPCTSGGSQCSGNTVCVEEHCVSPCGVGGTCATGLVCVNGGCMPDEKPQFVCGAEGRRGDGTTGNCAVGSICLRHNCYIACATGDGGADAGDACKNADRFNVCKAVATASGSYDVCGSATNLGSECDPKKACANVAQICIDGFCR